MDEQVARAGAGDRAFRALCSMSEASDGDRSNGRRIRSHRCGQCGVASLVTYTGGSLRARPPAAHIAGHDAAEERQQSAHEHQGANSRRLGLQSRNSPRQRIAGRHRGRCCSLAVTHSSLLGSRRSGCRVKRRPRTGVPRRTARGHPCRAAVRQPRLHHSSLSRVFAWRVFAVALYSSVALAPDEESILA